MGRKAGYSQGRRMAGGFSTAPVSGCGSRGLCRGIPFFFFFPSLLFPQRSLHPSPPPPEETRPSILPEGMHKSFLSPLNISHCHVRKDCSYPSTSSELKRKEVGKELSPVAEKERQRAKKKAPENSFPTFFFSFKAHSS